MSDEIEEKPKSKVWDVNIYTYTTAKSPRATAGAYGYVLEIIKDGEPVTKEFVGKLPEPLTANGAEVEAVLEAVKQLKGPCTVTIYSDSAYIVSSIRMLVTWYSKDWITARGQPVKYKEKWNEIMDLLALRTYRAEWQKKHSYADWINNQISKLQESEGNSDATSDDSV